MGFPVVYRRSGDPTLVNYNFTELASGLGYSTLNLVDVDPTGTYNLTSNTPYGKVGYKQLASADTFDGTFGISINLPLIVQGKCLINLPTYAYHATGSGTTNPIRTYTFFVKQNSTTLVSGAVTLDYATLAVGTGAFRNICLPLTIPKTQFKTGDTLNLQITATNDASSDNNTIIGLDPQNRTGTQLGTYADIVYTNARLYLPIKADL